MGGAGSRASFRRVGNYFGPEKKTIVEGGEGPSEWGGGGGWEGGRRGRGG